MLTIMRRLPHLLSLLALSITLLGVLAAPTMAAPGGTGAAVAKCLNGGYLAYTDADDTAFGNEGQCARYAATGGILIFVTPYLSGEYAQFQVSVFATTVTGKGLQPGALVKVTGTAVAGGTDLNWTVAAVSSTGEVSFGPAGYAGCDLYTTLTVTTLDRDGQTIQDTDPAPC